MTLILHTYTDIRLDDQVETLDSIYRMKAMYAGRVVSEKMVDPDDYWSFLLRNWGKEDIVIIEQDVVGTVGNIDKLIICREPVCANPYRLAAGQYSIFDIPEDTPTKNFGPPFNVNYHYPENHWNMPLPVYVGGMSLGFTKISLATQKKIPLWEYPVGVYEWWYLDSFISWHLNRLKQKVHVHTPEVKHNRTVEITFNIGDESFVVSNKD
jgi:hypothetical protein